MGRGRLIGVGERAIEFALAHEPTRRATDGARKGRDRNETASPGYLLFRLTFSGPNSELCVLVTYLAPFSIGGRCKGGLGFFNAVECNDNHPRFGWLALNCDGLSATREICA